ncbi:MAG: hypothetical protein ACXVP5_13405, partial [Tumebacillaceae bacterium]
DEKPRIWYREDKKTIYLVIRVEEYVLCHHFILEKKIPLATVVQHTDDFICGIMGEQGDFIGIVQLVLGGMKHVNS